MELTDTNSCSFSPSSHSSPAFELFIHLYHLYFTNSFLKNDRFTFKTTVSFFKTYQFILNCVITKLSLISTCVYLLLNSNSVCLFISFSCSYILLIDKTESIFSLSHHSNFVAYLVRPSITIFHSLLHFRISQDIQIFVWSPPLTTTLLVLLPLSS